jgi:hypothetical protein
MSAAVHLPDLSQFHHLVCLFSVVSTHPDDYGQPSIHHCLGPITLANLNLGTRSTLTNTTSTNTTITARPSTMSGLGSQTLQMVRILAFCEQLWGLLEKRQKTH